MLQNYNFYRVLKLFLDNPTRMFGWKELSSKLKLGPPSVKRYLDEMLKEGIILEKKAVGRMFYASNRESRRYRLFQTFDILLNMEYCGLVDHLNKECGFPTIVLIGSYARGEAVEGSDVDIVAVTESRKKVLAGEFEDKLKKPIHIFAFTRTELLKLKRLNPSLYSGIINGIVISGNLDV